MKTRYCFRFYSDYDVKGMTDFLDRMAAKGWLLSKKSGVYCKFVKTDKPFIKYNITYFADANKENDFYPYGADRYFEMRQEAGWQFLTNDRKMMIFISEDPGAVELETEPMVKVDVIHQSYTHSYLFMEIMPLLLAWQAYARLTDGFSSDIRITSGDLALCMAGIISVLNILSYFIWYFKAKKAAKEGWFYQTKTPFLKLYVMSVIFWWLIITLLSIPVLSIVI